MAEKDIKSNFSEIYNRCDPKAQSNCSSTWFKESQ